MKYNKHKSYDRESTVRYEDLRNIFRRGRSLECLGYIVVAHSTRPLLAPRRNRKRSLVYSWKRHWFNKMFGTIAGVREGA